MIKKLISLLTVLSLFFIAVTSCSIRNEPPHSDQTNDAPTEPAQESIVSQTDPQTFQNGSKAYLFGFNTYEKYETFLAEYEPPSWFIHYDSLRFLGDFYAMWYPPEFQYDLDKVDFLEYTYVFFLEEDYRIHYGYEPDEILICLNIKHTGATGLTRPEFKETVWGPEYSYILENGILQIFEDGNLITMSFVLDGVEFCFFVAFPYGTDIHTPTKQFLDWLYYPDVNYTPKKYPSIISSFSGRRENAITKFAQLMEESAAQAEEAATDTANTTDTLPLEE